MPRSKRTRALVEADLDTREHARRLGREVRASRHRRGLTQAALAARVALRQARISEIERGEGGSAPLRAWVALAGALGRSIWITMARDPAEGPADAGHLAVQELVLRLAREAGRRSAFELPTRASDPWRSADVGIRDDVRRQLLLVEAWNLIDDIGASARATSRKVAEADRLAATLGGDGQPYAVRSCWVVRATRRNRALVRRYPEVFAARFPGSSRAWVDALVRGVEPPPEPGLVWCDVGTTALRAWRRPARG